MVQKQPMKMAADEGLWETEDPASFSIFTIGNMREQKEVFSIRLPYFLSLLSYNQLYGEVQGMNDLQTEFEAEFGPGNYIPPAVVPYWSFRIMVGAGVLMILLALYALFQVMGETIGNSQRFLKILIVAIALPYIANTAGWLLTEVGRLPWVVYRLITLENSISLVVSSTMVLISLLGYLIVYSALIVATIYLLQKYAKAGPEPVYEQSVSDDELPSLVGAQD
jgi:cytochrome d ubiquinol oxidase subunit I